MSSFTFENTTYFHTPFPHCYVPQLFSHDFAAGILGWLQTSAPWTLTLTDFYEQFEFNLFDAALPRDLAFLISEEFVASISKEMEATFAIKLAKEVSICAHRLANGHRIRIHNDTCNQRETHRLVVQLNSGWQEKNGGFLMLFSSDDPSDVSKVISPLSNSAVGFEISECSHHAVSVVKNSDRFTLIFTFRRLSQE